MDDITYKLFKALNERHPGYAVLDIKFIFDHNFIGPIEDLETLDMKLAIAVKKAKTVDIASIFWLTFTTDSVIIYI